jgi:hypothetical protein
LRQAESIQLVRDRRNGANQQLGFASRPFALCGLPVRCPLRSRNADHPVLSDEFENVLVLSDEFFQEITAHPMPADLDAVRVLAAAPAVLDLFMWLSYRCFSAKGAESIPIFGDFGLAAQLGNVEYARPRRFREKPEQWLKTVRPMWPQCPARINDEGTHLTLRPAIAIHPRGGSDVCA